MRRATLATRSTRWPATRGTTRCCTCSTPRGIWKKEPLHRCRRRRSESSSHRAQPDDDFGRARRERVAREEIEYDRRQDDERFGQQREAYVQRGVGEVQRIRQNNRQREERDPELNVPDAARVPEPLRHP